MMTGWIFKIAIV
jgi:hypothetical protein